jgi:hypothetical protein
LELRSELYDIVGDVVIELFMELVATPAVVGAKGCKATAENDDNAIDGQDGIDTLRHRIVP